MVPVLQTIDLHKSYGAVTALDGLNLSVERGEVVGLLGPNGAGKSTSVNLIMGLLEPTHGRVELFGQDLARHRSSLLRRVNFASAYAGLPRDLTVRENLQVFADLYEVRHPRDRIDWLMRRLDLTELGGRRVWNLSAGQRMRVVLAKAMLNEPELLLLDEPTASLDPDTADRVRHDLASFAAAGTTLIWTSHNLPEVERHCNRVVFLNQGKVVLDGAPRDLAREAGRVLVRVRPAENRAPAAPFVADAEAGWFRAEAHDDAEAADLIAAARADGPISALDMRRPTLEDLFIILARGGWS
jgi:ABC-2 type transport system ATP-binding protein